MHSYQPDDNNFTILYNSDFSGDAIIRDQREPNLVLYIPAKHLVEFVAYCYVMQRKSCERDIDRILGL